MVVMAAMASMQTAETIYHYENRVTTLRKLKNQRPEKSEIDRNLGENQKKLKNRRSREIFRAVKRN